MREGVLWTNLSRAAIADELGKHGFHVSVPVVAQLLERHHLGRRKAQKSLPLKRHAQRDQQFQIITRLRAEYENSPNPIFSVDTKHKEFLGQLFRAGRLYTQKPLQAFDHDFPSSATGVLYPHGIYDCKRNLGHINIGLSHDTSRFACDSIAYYWNNHGRAAFPNASSIMMLCDGGGSNAASRYIFKYYLELLAELLGVEIRVAHYPPYCSKYNPIEHRFFPHVTRACQGLLFSSLDVVREAMANASTSTGLATTVNVIPGDYPIGEKAPKGYKKTTKILFAEELPAWNYRAVPAKWVS